MTFSHAPAQSRNETYRDHFATTSAIALSGWGGSVLTLGPGAAALAYWLVRCGRRVAAVDPSPAALSAVQALLSTESDDLQARIRLDAAQPERALPADSAYDLIVLNDALGGASVPAECVPPLLAGLAVEGRLLVTVSDADPRSRWRFSPGALGLVLARYNVSEIAANADGSMTRAVVARRPPRRAPSPRIAAVVRISAQSGVLEAALASVTDIADAVVVYLDGAPLHAEKFAAQSAGVVRVVPGTGTGSSLYEAIALAQALRPDWILMHDGAHVLERDAPRRIRAALANAANDLAAFELRALVVDNRPDRIRVDLPASGLASRIVRAAVATQPHDALALDAVSKDFTPFISGARSALPASSWQERADARTAQRESLLGRALAALPGTAETILVSTPGNIDVARLVKERWPGARATGVLPADQRHAGVLTAFDYTVSGDISELPVLLGDTRFDHAIVCENPGRVADREYLEAIARYLEPAAHLIVECADESFLQRGLLIDLDRRIWGAFAGDPAGLRHTVVIARGNSSTAKPRPLTIAVPVRDGTASVQRVLDDLQLDAADRNVAVALVLRDPFAAFDGAPSGAGSLTTAFEPGAEGWLFAALSEHPAQIACCVRPGTSAAPGWLDALRTAFDRPQTAVVALASDVTVSARLRPLAGRAGEHLCDWADAPILAVRTAVVGPAAWPRDFHDDVLRSGLVAGIAAHAGYDTIVLDQPRIVRAAAPQRASAERYAHELERARDLGIPSERPPFVLGA